MLAVRGREVTMARHPNPAKIEPVVTSKCTSGRPLLIDSGPQTEFTVTHSKQTTGKFLTGARTHISIFNFSPFTTQNPAQLIHRRRLNHLGRLPSKYSTRVNSLLSRRFIRASLRSVARPTADNRRRNPYQIPKTVPPENSTRVSLFLIPKTLPPENSTGVSQFLSRCLIRASLRFNTRSAPKTCPLRRTSTRFCTKYRKRRNFLKTNDGRFSTRGHNHLGCGFRCRAHKPVR